MAIALIVYGVFFKFFFKPLQETVENWIDEKVAQRLITFFAALILWLLLMAIAIVSVAFSTGIVLAALFIGISWTEALTGSLIGCVAMTAGMVVGRITNF
ncbi:hypothetical protein [Altererythrobacter litoralis]|uniref:Uncharacterized protein n=1 Tax=Altererythrobacter litoralis TaxID=3113904 RepID=A0ABU7GFQ6_9SPHN|nr:hypothetical protein [Erythrobacteraceae bacterium 1XM1-14]